MKTLLVPVDFTAASENAINFAATWSTKYNYERIIALRSFYTSMYENVIIGRRICKRGPALSQPKEGIRKRAAFG